MIEQNIDTPKLFVFRGFIDAIIKWLFDWEYQHKWCYGLFFNMITNHKC